MSLLNTQTSSRLCEACGLCCNGVLFHNVRLQPGDVASDLVKLGLHIKRKKGGALFQQPCPALMVNEGNACCSIYHERPTRCRLFECQQLAKLNAGEITESDALAKIRDVQQRVQQINSLLTQAGSTNLKRPLSKRCETILATPAFEPEMKKLHENISEELAALETLLEADFRV